MVVIKLTSGGEFEYDADVAKLQGFVFALYKLDAAGQLLPVAEYRACAVVGARLEDGTIIWSEGVGESEREAFGQDTHDRLCVSVR